MNVVVISGNLTKDPQLKQTQGGTSILNFSVAVNDRKKNAKTGEWEDVAHFVDCVMFGKRAESLSRILHKGSRVYVDGKLSYNSWEAKDGSRRSKLEVIANDVELPPRSKGQHDGSQGDYGHQPNNYTQQQQYAPQNGSQQPTGGNYGYQQRPEMDVYSSDIPF